MSHVEPDQLALLALGEPVVTSEEEKHLSSCAQCAAELSEMRRTVVIARSTVGESALEAPPPAVWVRITQELGLGEPAAAPSPEPVDEPVDQTQEASDAPATAPSDRPRERRGARRLWVLAASIVLIAVVGAGAWALVQRLAPVSIAQASLAAFPDHPDAEGSAEIEEARDGSRTLTVTLDAGTSSDAYREVWLIRNDAGALISLGVLVGEEGSFPIPEGVDLAEYSLVDVSVEPIDGDPAHSGDSIVRGELTFA